MGRITYYSTNNRSERASFETALMNGLASNYGLYMIAKKDIPVMSPDAIQAMGEQSYAQIAFHVLYPFLREDIPDSELREMLANAYDDSIIPTEVAHVTGKTHIMWLTRGPTYSFKDYAARFSEGPSTIFSLDPGLAGSWPWQPAATPGGPWPMPSMAWSRSTMLCFFRKDRSPNGSGDR